MEHSGDSNKGLNTGKTEKKARKKVSKSKRVKKTKRRGTYKPKSKASDDLPTVILADIDLAECVYSDEEERLEFLRDVDLHQSATIQVTPVVNEPSTTGIPTIDNSESGTAEASESTGKVLPVHTSSQYSADTSDEGLPPGTSHDITLHTDSSASLSVPGSSTVGAVMFTENSSGIATPSSLLATPDIDVGISQVSGPQVSSNVSNLTGSSTELSTSINKSGSNQICSQYYPGLELIEVAIAKFKEGLLQPWVPIASRKGFHLLLVSDGPPKAIQREIFMSYEGAESVFVHCKPLPFGETLLESVNCSAVKLHDGSVNDFCERGIKIARKLMQYDICVGANHMETQSHWGQTPNTVIDNNSYQESKFSSTCRSLSCTLLIELGKGKRCMPCNVVIRSLRSREKFLSSLEVHPNTPNIYLSHDQALQKLQLQQEEIKKKIAQIASLKQRMQKILDEEGVVVEENLSQDLSHILTNSKNLSPIQQMFLQEQFDQSNKADARSHRWHPDMIRFALHIKMISSAAYEAIRDAGLIKLPSSRTLFDYSHSFAAQEGVSEGILDIVTDRVASLKKKTSKVCRVDF